MLAKSDCSSIPPSFLISQGMPNRRKRACIQQCRFEHKCGRDKPAFLARQIRVAKRHGERR